MSADVVVGFQTTALFEAMLARKPVLYTAWDPESIRLGPELIPFADWDSAITVLRSPEDLAPAVRTAGPPGAGDGTEARGRRGLSRAGRRPRL